MLHILLLFRNNSLKDIMACKLFPVFRHSTSSALNSLLGCCSTSWSSSSIPRGLLNYHGSNNATKISSIIFCRSFAQKPNLGRIGVAVPKPSKGFNVKSVETVCAIIPNNNVRVFHTSSRRWIHPLLLLVIKPVGKLASIIGGRTVRKWWSKLTPEQKAKFRARMGEKKHYFAALFALLGVYAVVHYITHIQETPITHRRRYISLTDEQAQKIAQFEFQMQYEAVKDRIMPITDPSYRRIYEVGQRIVDCNQDIEFMRKQQWIVIVVDSEEQNAFVLPSGHIFVYTGILKTADTDQKLAVILGHEISHALLNHAAEQVSFSTVLDAVIIIVMAAIWTIMPSDGIALITQWFYDKCMHLILNLPYSRKLEKEADEVGLQLIAKACYDVRESSLFWTMMKFQDEYAGGDSIPQWLSTHPANAQRAADLNKLIPEAIKLREACKCEALPAKDPRDIIPFMKQVVQERHQERLVQQKQQKLLLIKPTPMKS